MNQEYVEIIKNDPNYNKLVKVRTKYAFILSVIMLTVYFSFILIIAFEPTLLSIKLATDSVITLGIPMGVFIILLAFVLTGLYVKRANSEFDLLSKKVKDSLTEKLNA